MGGMRVCAGQLVNARLPPPTDFADASTQMRLVEVGTAGDFGDALPLVYDPEAIAAYWSRRPVAVVTRITQLLGERWPPGYMSVCMEGQLLVPARSRCHSQQVVNVR